MNEKTLIDMIALSNQWWADLTNFPNKTYSVKRTDFYFLWKSYLNEKEALLIYGPRGVGKSTVMYEMMKELLGIEKDEELHESNEIIEKERILYLSFEDPVFKKFSLQDIIALYSKYILKEDISKLSKKVFIFFDEIQNIEHWGDQIKAIVDRNYNLKIVISGSSSVALKNEASRAARRITMYSMHPLKFFDFMRFKLNDAKFSSQIKAIKEIRENILDAFIKKDSRKIYDLFLQFYALLKPWQTHIEIGFQDYLIKGGYPNYVDETDFQKISSKLNETFRLGFHKDLVFGGNIGDPKGMENLTTYIASISSSETSYNSLIQNTQSAKNSEHMRKYLYHLENSFLIKDSHKYFPDAKKKVRGFKVYLIDVAIRNMLQGLMNRLLESNQTQYGYAIETVVFEHAVRLFHKIRSNYPMQYWKGNRGQEVDMVLQLNGKGIPIEVKKSDDPKYADLLGLRAFVNKYDIPGMVVCGKKLDIQEKIVFVPHWLFLLMC